MEIVCSGYGDLAGILSLVTFVCVSSWLKWWGYTCYLLTPWCRILF